MKERGLQAECEAEVRQTLESSVKILGAFAKPIYSANEENIEYMKIRMRRRALCQINDTLQELGLTR